MEGSQACPWEGATAELAGLVHNMNLGSRRGRLPESGSARVGPDWLAKGAPQSFQRRSGGALPNYYAASQQQQEQQFQHQQRPSYGGPASLGWGGQAIPGSAPGFKAPWFGRSRGRGGGGGGTPNAGWARGRQQGGGGSRRPSRPAWGSAEQRGDITVEHLVGLVGSIPAGQRISDGVLQALFQMDGGRSVALLMKELSKAGMQARCGGWRGPGGPAA